MLTSVELRAAPNAQRKHKVHPHSALADFFTALLTRAGERTASTLLQRQKQKNQRNTARKRRAISHNKQNTRPTSLPAALAKPMQPRAEGQHEN